MILVKHICALGAAGAPSLPAGDQIQRHGDFGRWINRIKA
jgi:hypothetical protein